MSNIERCMYCAFGDCYACHGTGFAGARHGDEPEEGVTCEACDGSGQDPTYVRARANGMPASGRKS